MDFLNESSNSVINPDGLMKQFLKGYVSEIMIPFEVLWHSVLTWVVPLFDFSHHWILTHFYS